MAKKEEGITTTAQSAVMQALLRKNQETYGHSFVMARDSDVLFVGLPFKHLSLMYLFDSTVFPLSKVVGFAGAPKSMKSALGFEIMRWFAEANGYGFLAECEGGKYSPSLHKSIVGPRLWDEDRFAIKCCATIQEAQEFLTSVTKLVKTENPERNVPYCLMIDSLVGAGTEEGAAQLFKDGSLGERGFPREALAWSGFFRNFPASLTSWPISFVFINHLKQGIDSRGGPPIERVSGGDRQIFHSAFVINVYRRGKDSHETIEKDGETQYLPNDTRTIRLKTWFTSGGTDGRDIRTDFTWYTENGEQKSWFDWEGSTAYLLSELQEDKSRSGDRSTLADHCDVAETNKRFSSKKLGVSKVSATELGKAAEADAKLIDELQAFWGIHKHPQFVDHMLTVDEIRRLKGAFTAPLAAPAPPAAPEIKIPKLDAKAGKNDLDIG